jgi:hypothetical protein
MLIRDMVEDLAEFSLGDIEQAIKRYRQNPANKYFPTSGQLRAPILEAIKERRDSARISDKPLAESRPLMWWYQNPKFWKPHWRENDIPSYAWESYFAWKAKVGA